MDNQTLQDDLTEEEADQLYDKLHQKFIPPDEPARIKVEEGLTFGMYGKPGEDAKWLRLYECEHIMAGTIPVATDHSIIHLGDHHSVILCRHCAAHMVGMVTQQLLMDSLKGHSLAEIKAMLEAGREGYAQQRQADQQTLNNVAGHNYATLNDPVFPEFPKFPEFQRPDPSIDGPKSGA